MLIVQKYGGTSVADVDRIRNVVGRIARTRSAGHEVVAVVSAMAGETNRLLALAKAAAQRPDERETDALIASGAHGARAPGRRRPGAVVPRPPGPHRDRHRARPGPHPPHRRRRAPPGGRRRPR